MISRDEQFVRLRAGFRDHLAYFAGHGSALSVFLDALFARDWSTGVYSGELEAIARRTGLTERQVRRALQWLAHGRGCPCGRCDTLGVHDRPQYLELERRPSRGRPALYRVLRDDSLSRDERAAERAGQLRLVPPREQRSA